MLEQFGENVFQGRVIEVHIGTLISDQHLPLLTGHEMKAKPQFAYLKKKSHRITQSIDKKESRHD